VASTVFIAAQSRHRLGRQENRAFYELHLTPPVFYPHFGGCSRSTRPLLLGSVRAGTLSYSAMQLFSNYSNLCENHTDRRYAITALCVASRGNKRYIIHIYLIFLETTITGPHFTADNIGLSSVKFFWWAPEFLFISASGVFPPFKVIQGH